MKNEVTVNTGRQKGFRERVYIFKTDQDIPLEYFKTRKSLDEYSFPRYVEGTVEDYSEGGGGMVDWKDFDDFYDFKINNIESIYINGVNINQEIIDEAEKRNATVRFPLMYHVQFEFKDIPEWIFNWYPTTGTLSKQKATEKQYSMKSLGNYSTIKEALEACK
jgi:hypothetical protein